MRNTQTYERMSLALAWLLALVAPAAADCPDGFRSFNDATAHLSTS